MSYEEQLEFIKELAQGLWLEGWNIAAEGKPFNSCSTYSEKRGWKDYHHLVTKQGIKK